MNIFAKAPDLILHNGRFTGVRSALILGRARLRLLGGLT